MVALVFCAGREQPIRRSPRVEVVRGLEVARPHLISPAIFKHELQQRVGLREIGEIGDAGAHLQRAGRLPDQRRRPIGEFRTRAGSSRA